MKLRAVSGIMLTLLLIGMLTLTFNIHPVKSEPMGEVLFFDDFSDELWTEQHWTVELGNFEVINGEYFTQTPIGEESYAAVNNLNFIDGIIEVKLRFTDAVGFQAWIFFRHTLQTSSYTGIVSMSVLNMIGLLLVMAHGENLWGDLIIQSI